MLYKFKVKKLINLLEIDNLNLNDLITSSNIFIITSTKRFIEASSTKRFKVIRKLLVKRAVAIRVSLKPSTIVALNAIIIIIRYIFFANLESYRS